MALAMLERFCLIVNVQECATARKQLSKVLPEIDQGRG